MNKPVAWSCWSKGMEAAIITTTKPNMCEWESVIPLCAYLEKEELNSSPFDSADDSTNVSKNSISQPYAYAIVQGKDGMENVSLQFDHPEMCGQTYIQAIPLYTHPVKENWKCSAPPCKCDSSNFKVCGYSSYTHPVKEPTWKKEDEDRLDDALEKAYGFRPHRELTDEEICKIFNEHTGLGIHQKEADKADLLVFARAILDKAQEK